MAIRYYDEALVNKLKNWTSNTDVTITGPDETRRMFEVIADKTKDKPIKLPLICLRRGKGFEVQSTSKKPLSFDAMSLEDTKEKSLQLNAIPINIPYQLDIYTRYFAEADEYVRNFIFNIINYPKLEITLPYMGKNVIQVANIRMMGNVEDNSDIPERLVPGQFTRYTLSLYIDDAYLYDLRIRDNYSISATIDAKFNEEKNTQK